MISFVVDKLPAHYYQAELLLHSLEQNTSYTKETIVVQCLSRVDKEFLDYLTVNNYTFNIIEPYLDGKYCNKLQQLEYFIDKGIDGVILMDTDMFAMGDLSDICGKEIIAKRVDAPNPSLVTLQNIYKQASLATPSVVKSDWDMPNNETLENNFNGGFYYVPQHLISTMSKEWKKWGEWLYAQPELFEHKSQFIHVDQISFSLAVHANKLAYKLLSANYNFPIHSSLKIDSFEDTKEIKIIHYHREINDFGLLNSSKTRDINTLNTIQKANDSIVSKDRVVFYKQYKKSLRPKLLFSDKVLLFEEKLKQLLANKKFNLILHAGTPKTGTTSLQHFLADSQDALKKHKFLYPSNYVRSPEPKHQWLVGTLKEGDFEQLFEFLEETIDEAEECSAESIILSTEGIYNHWLDYNEESRAILSLLSKYFTLSLVVFFRNEAVFMNNLYKQYLKNAKQTSISCYGQDVSLQKMIDDSWFIKHLDYLGFIYDCESIFSKENVKVIEYSKNIIQDFCNTLKIEIEIKMSQRKNSSLSDFAIEILQVINSYEIRPQDRVELIKELSTCDTILKNYSKKNSEFKNIEEMFRLQKEVLKEEYELLLF